MLKILRQSVNRTKDTDEFWILLSVRYGTLEINKTGRFYNFLNSIQNKNKSFIFFLRSLYLDG